MIRWAIVTAGLLAAMPAVAQVPATRVIQVTGTGVVQTIPDVALLNIYLRGEGTTPDAATAALAARQKAVAGGLASLLGREGQLTTGNVTIIEARGESCADNRGYNSQPKVSAGACAIVGYIATMQTSLRTRNVDKAATAAGLASRLGASDARLDGFELSDPDAVQARAGAAAMTDARKRAATLATNAGVRLGAVTEVRDQANYGGMQARSSFDEAAPPAPPPPPPPAAPIELDAKPRPIETRAQVFVTYAIAP